MSYAIGLCAPRAKGDMSGPIALLASDGGLHFDGGRKALALPNVIPGGADIARALIAGAQGCPKVSYRAAPRSTENAAPSDLCEIGHSPSLSYMRAPAICGSYTFVSNPDKLCHLPSAAV